jgi:hypothetical protein
MHRRCSTDAPTAAPSVPVPDPFTGSSENITESTFQITSLNTDTIDFDILQTWIEMAILLIFLFSI